MKPKNRYSSLYFPIRLTIFYFIGLLLWRILFIGYNDVPDLILPLVKAISLDISMICGVIIVGIIPWLAYLMIGWGWIIQLNKWLHIFLQAWEIRNKRSYNAYYSRYIFDKTLCLAV